MVAAGLALVLYPNLQTVISQFYQSEAIRKYEDSLLHYDEEQVRQELAAAEEYNKSVAGTEVHDPFVPGSGAVIPDNYDEVLNIDQGIMGRLEIPCISVDLPIYHGVEESALRNGVGHLKETPFPIGGEGNHSVLSTHRGLPEARLFTDLDKMEIGDEFYIHILNDVLAYRVDQIKVITPDRTDYLKPVEGEDHVTLLTCTPYGINSHRLLVRGIRTEYNPEVKETVQTRVIPIEWLVLAAVFVGLVIVLICGISRRRKKRRTRNGRESDCRDIKKRNTDEEKT